MADFNFYRAIEDFGRARRRASLERIMARLTGKSADLLSYEDVRKKLRAQSQGQEHLKEIPLDAIVGSVGRYGDFTRSFLPKQDSNQSRWVRVKQAIISDAGVPPVKVYQIGEAFFVLDGNHRVSVARQLGTTHIEAFVVQVRTRVPLSPDDQPDDLILKAEYTDFLQDTRLDELRPQADLGVTVPGQYRALCEHIRVHRYFMGLDFQRDISWEQAVTHWYDEVYAPVVQLIGERSILRDFPDRTATDLYLWICEHRAALEQELGWEIEPAAAAADLAAQASPKAERVVARVSARLLDAVLPDEMEAGPSPGRWREERLADRQDERLFASVLVAVNGKDCGWQALEQAILLAQREGARLFGLHVTSTQAEVEGKAAQGVRDEFQRRCVGAGVTGKLAVMAGQAPQAICERARWADLVVLNLAYPPPPGPLAKLGSGFRKIIQRCPRPLLAVPCGSFPLERVLLAFDGSPKAEEALFIATYMAGRWQASLTVVTVAEAERATSKTLARAQDYLSVCGVEAAFVSERGEVAEAIIKTAREQHSDLIVMGGYGHSPVVEVVLGSAVNQVLRESQQPVLICR